MKPSPRASRRAICCGERTITSIGKGAATRCRIAAACCTSRCPRLNGITTRTSTSESSLGVPCAYEPKTIICSGRNSQATISHHFLMSRRWIIPSTFSFSKHKELGHRWQSHHAKRRKTLRFGKTGYASSEFSLTSTTAGPTSGIGWLRRYDRRRCFPRRSNRQWCARL
jgi:hypothetical protein